MMQAPFLGIEVIIYDDAPAYTLLYIVGIAIL